MAQADKPCDRPPAPKITLVTTPNPGPIAILQLHGFGITRLLAELTGVQSWPLAQVRYVQFGQLDDGCATVLRGEPHGMAQLMPHGGPRVVQKLIEQLCDLGGQWCQTVSSRQAYPEARSELEADMMQTLAQAASPAAVDLLLAQPDLWQRAINTGFEVQALVACSRGLDRLVIPATVALLGPPNAGKSTLTNRLIGRMVSHVSELPGTPRDWVGGLVQLRPSSGSNLQPVAVNWLDTPGLRASGDVIEQRAIDMARRVVIEADVLIAIRDPQTQWSVDCPRKPDLWVVNKIDDEMLKDPAACDDAMAISAKTGLGIEKLEAAVVEKLGLSAVKGPRLWAFSPQLRNFIETGDRVGMRRYAGLG